MPKRKAKPKKPAKRKTKAPKAAAPKTKRTAHAAAPVHAEPVAIAASPVPSRPRNPDQGEIRVGISGWRYEPWRGVFYPKGLRQQDELKHASSLLNSIEINGTFYSLQRPTSFASWAADVPPDFVFSVKAPRFITHILRLRDAKMPLANFFASGLLKLGAAFGPILWQLPPNFKFDRPLIEEFLQLLPHDTAAAEKIACEHGDKVKNRAWTKALVEAPVRHAMEARNASFLTPQFIELLREYNVAVVCADSPEWPQMMDLTADFVYCRLHGSEVLYTDGYDEKSLKEWAARVAGWSRGENPDTGKLAAQPRFEARTIRDVYVYFDNDSKVCAPRDAQRMRKLVDAM